MDPAARTWRPGAVGALMDEYERAAAELRRVVEPLADEAFERVRDADTADPDCRSIQTVMTHVARAGYRYAFLMRQAFGMPAEEPTRTPPLSRQAALDALAAMLAHTVETLEGRWEMPDAAMEAVRIRSPWGVEYDLEQMLEHAIVHLLRHRRQIERFLAAVP